MKLSTKGLLEIAESEGVVPAPYLDSRNIWTYGVGHTAAAGSPDPATLPRGMPSDVTAGVVEALRVFARDVPKYEARVNAAISTPLTQHQFDALVAIDFNTGCMTWRDETTKKPCQLVQQVNRGDMSGDGFMGWLSPPELRKRRIAEQNLFRTGNYDANGESIPVWKVAATGKRRGISHSLSGKELLGLMGRPQATPSVAERAKEPAAQLGILGVLLAALAAFLATRG